MVQIDTVKELVLKWNFDDFYTAQDQPKLSSQENALSIFLQMQSSVIKLDELIFGS